MAAFTDASNLSLLPPGLLFLSSNRGSLWRKKVQRHNVRGQALALGFLSDPLALYEGLHTNTGARTHGVEMWRPRFCHIHCLQWVHLPPGWMWSPHHTQLSPLLPHKHTSCTSTNKWTPCSSERDILETQWVYIRGTCRIVFYLKHPSTDQIIKQAINTSCCSTCKLTAHLYRVCKVNAKSIWAGETLANYSRVAASDACTLLHTLTHTERERANYHAAIRVSTHLSLQRD